MTPEAQRIAIAEACGWSDCHTYTTAARLFGKCPTPNPNTGKRGWTTEVPEYLTDLNAMHEAEKTIKSAAFAWSTYWNALCAVVLPDDAEHCGYNLALVAHATASQRAEAFLRTLDLWQDTPCLPPPTPA